MVPSKIKPFFKVDYIKNDIISGSINCCKENNFKIYYTGMIEKNIILGTYLCGKNDAIELCAKCSKCGRLISVFNSCQDGYDACCLDSEISRNLNETEDKNKLLNCNRCNGDNFSVFIKYEYSEEEELKELGFKDISNAFTWITISLTCNNCGKKYKRFIDFES